MDLALRLEKAARKVREIQAENKRLKKLLEEEVEAYALEGGELVVFRTNDPSLLRMATGALEEMAGKRAIVAIASHEVEIHASVEKEEE